MAAGLIHLRNLDEELKKIITGQGLTDAQIEHLLSCFFNKETDKIKLNQIDQSVLDAINASASNINTNGLSVLLNNYFKNTDIIPKENISRELLNNIENNAKAIKALQDSFFDSDGNKIDITDILEKIEKMEKDAENNISASDINKAKEECNNYTNSQLELINSTSTSILNELNKVQDSLSNYRDKDTAISEQDLSVGLKDKIKILENNIELLNTEISSASTKIEYKNVGLKIDANDHFSIETNNPFSYDIKVLVYDNNENSPTYGLYINSEAIITVGIKYKTIEEEFIDNEEDAEKIKTSLGDEPVFYDLENNTDDSTPLEKERYEIKIINEINEPVYIRLLYKSSMDTNKTINSNIIVEGDKI